MTTENKWEHVTEVLRSELKNYLQKNKLQSVVLGESGGVDSALTSALVAEVFTYSIYWSQHCHRNKHSCRDRKGKCSRRKFLL